MAGPAAGEAQFGIPVEAVVTGSIVVAQTPNRPAWTVRTVTIASAGTPQQGPDVAIPDGFAVAVKARSTQPSGNIIFQATSGANTALSANRAELKPAEIITLKITNLNLLFFDANNDGSIVELIVEQ